MQPLATALALLLVPAALLLTSRTDPEPSPALSPAEVVRLQVEALQHNDDPYPNAGIETAFVFASPSNRAATGPLPRFGAMVRGPVYGDMLDFESAEFGDIVVEGPLAAQRVTLLHADGRRVTYVFSLSRQEGGRYDGCWMTDGVARQPDGPVVFERV